MTDISSKLQTSLNQALQGIESLDNGEISKESTTFLNSIWGLTQNSEAAISGNDNEKAQAINNIVQNVLSLLTKLGTNENKKASQEVKNNTKTSNKIEEKSNKVSNETKNSITNYMSDIVNESKNISEAIDIIKELSGTEEEKENAQKQLEKQTEIIEENLAIINDGVSTPEAKQNALTLIKGASAEISNITASLTFLQEKTQEEIQAQNNIIENSTNKIGSLLEKTTNVIIDSSNLLKNYSKEATSNLKVNYFSEIQGTGQNIAGKTIQGMATSTGILPGSQILNQRLTRIGLDQTMAGSTRISGASKNIASLSKTLGSVGSSLSNISEEIKNLQGVGNGVEGLIGSYQSAINPLITATGSWAEVASANDELIQSIAEYEGTNVKESQNNFDTNKKTDNTTYLNFNKNENNQTINNTPNDKKLEFDTKKFKVAFGI